MLKSIIMQVLHDETEADDVLQEVFLQVWDRAPSYSSRKGKLLSWLCTLARRRAIDRLRQHERLSASHRPLRGFLQPFEQGNRRIAHQSSEKRFVTIFVRSCISTSVRCR